MAAELPERNGGPLAGRVRSDSLSVTYGVQIEPAVSLREVSSIKRGPSSSNSGLNRPVSPSRAIQSL
jgi:hypothetical protein